MSARTRVLTARLLVVVASLVLLLAVVAGYVRHVGVNSEQFSDRATRALRNDDVRSLLATEITDRVVLRRAPDLVAARPLIQSVTAAAIGGRAFTGLFRSGVAAIHRAVFTGSAGRVALSIAGTGPVIAGNLQTISPSLARLVAPTRRVTVISEHIGSLAATLARTAGRVTRLAWLLGGLWVVLVVAAVAVSPRRLTTIQGLGVGIAGAGAALVVGLTLARAVAVHHLQTPGARAAAGAVWAAFLGDLHTVGWIMAAGGAAIAAAVAGVGRGENPWRRRAVIRSRGRALSAIGLVGAGVLALADPPALLAIVLTLGGVCLIYAGVAFLLELCPPSAAPQPPAESGGRRRVSRPLAATLLAGGVLLGGAYAAGAVGDSSAPGPRPAACEGYAALCDRPFNAVALAATHNAMSAPLPGWFSAEQEAAIPDQLRDGIRGLLIDTYYADRLRDGKVRTDVSDRIASIRRAGGDLTGFAVRRALALRDRLGFKGRGTRGIYLCHGFCELGATPLSTVLEQLRDYLAANPDQVLVVINEDRVAARDYVAAIRRAGLAPLAYRGPFTGRWLTLREMIDRRQRIVFLAENHAGAAPWYRLAYRGITEETPYTFRRVSQLADPAELAASCRARRGRKRSALFLLNNWVSTDPVPLPSLAAKVNAYSPLLRRARACERARHHIPNLVAVNFYRRGNLLGVVDALNGVDRRRS